jgi:hypothetical protein
MPGGITLLQSLAADIPTPPAGKVTIFFNTTTALPSYKDSTGAVSTLGTIGATGAAGPSGVPGFAFDGEAGDFMISQPGPQGNPGTTGPAGPVGPIMVVEDGLAGEDGIPGPAGTNGSGSSDWTITVIKSADQDVTNSAVLVNCTDLVIAVLSGETWIFQLILLYSGSSASGDFRLNFTFPSSSEIHRYMNLSTADSGTGSPGVGGVAATALSAVITAGTDASDTTRPLLLDLMITAGASGNVQVQFAQFSAVGGTHARVKLGSILRGKKII